VAATKFNKIFSGRQKTRLVLQHTKPRRKTVTKEEKRTHVTLRNDKNFVILPAVKGNSSVVILDQDYLNKY
jgi:hypothetical protein